MHLHTGRERGPVSPALYRQIVGANRKERQRELTAVIRQRGPGDPVWARHEHRRIFQGVPVDGIQDDSCDSTSENAVLYCGVLSLGPAAAACHDAG